MLQPIPVQIFKATQPWAVIHQIAEDGEPEIQKAVLLTVAALKSGTTLSKVQRAIDAGDLEGAYDAIPWSEIEKLQPDLTRTLRDILERSAHASADLLPKIDIRFDVTNPRSVEWIRENAARLVTEVGDGTKLAIRDVIRTAFEEGMHPRKAAVYIRDLIGLTSRQTRAVENYRAMLESEGKKYSDVTRLTESYSRRQLRSRALTIAITESHNASHAGQQHLWEQALDDHMLDERARKHWIVVRPCKICAQIPGMNPEGVPIRGTFWTPVGPRLGPTIHPRCFCGVVLKFRAV